MSVRWASNHLFSVFPLCTLQYSHICVYFTLIYVVYLAILSYMSVRWAPNHFFSVFPLCRNSLTYISNKRTRSGDRHYQECRLRSRFVDFRTTLINYLLVTPLKKVVINVFWEARENNTLKTCSL